MSFCAQFYPVQIVTCNDTNLFDAKISLSNALTQVRSKMLDTTLKELFISRRVIIQSRKKEENKIDFRGVDLETKRHPKLNYCKIS